MTTPVGDEGYVGFAVQSAKGTAATALFRILHTAFSWEPDVIQDEEPEAEIGAPGLDTDLPERWGHQGATFTGELRFRPGNAGFILRAFGMEADDGPFVIVSGGNDTIRVTDDGGGPVDVNILTGAGATLDGISAYTGAEIAAGLKAVLDADPTLSTVFTVTYALDLFTIATAGTLLTLHHTAPSSNLSPYLGFDTAADDTGAATYDADNETDYPLSHVFSPIDSSADFPWITVLDQFNEDADLDTLLIDARVRTMTFSADANNLVRLSYEGRSLDFEDATGSETDTEDNSAIGTPNTGDENGFVVMDGIPYWIHGFEMAFSWEEGILPRLAQFGPEELTIARRRASGRADIYFGADQGDMFRKTYYGGAAGTTFSTTITQEPFACRFAAGAETPVAAGDDQLPYAVAFGVPECNFLTYPLTKAGGEPVDAGMNWVASRRDAVYSMVLTNGYVTAYYD